MARSARSLVIVESPAKAKTINHYLGPGYLVKASMGHVRDLPKSKLGVDVEHDFEPTYQVIPDKKKVVAELKKLAKESDVGHPGGRPGPGGRGHRLASEPAHRGGEPEDLPGGLSTRSPRRASRRRSSTSAGWTSPRSRPSRRGGSWTGSSATSSARSSGRRSAAA